MKKLFVFVCFIVLFNVSFGQIEQGNWLVGGSISFDSYTRHYDRPIGSIIDRNTDINFSPKIGYFIFDNAAVGLKPLFNYGHYRPLGSSNAGTSRTYSFGIGPFIRYYFLKSDKPYNLLLESSYIIGKMIQPDPPRVTGENNEFSIMAGPEIFFNSSAAIEILLGYKNIRQSLDNPYLVYDDNRNGFYASVGVILHLVK